MSLRNGACGCPWRENKFNIRPPPCLLGPINNVLMVPTLRSLIKLAAVFLDMAGMYNRVLTARPSGGALCSQPKVLVNFVHSDGARLDQLLFQELRLQARSQESPIPPHVLLLSSQSLWMRHLTPEEIDRRQITTLRPII